MATKTTVAEATVNGQEVILIKPSKPMTEKEWALMSNMVAAENKKGGVQQVLIPYSADYVGTQPAEAKATTKKRTTTKK